MSEAQAKPWEQHPWWPIMMIWLEQQKRTCGLDPDQRARRENCAALVWRNLMEVERGLWDDRFDRLCVMVSNGALAGIGRTRTFVRPLFEQSLTRRGVPIPPLVDPKKRSRKIRMSSTFGEIGTQGFKFATTDLQGIREIS